MHLLKRDWDRHWVLQTKNNAIGWGDKYAYQQSLNAQNCKGAKWRRLSKGKDTSRDRGAVDVCKGWYDKRNGEVPFLLTKKNHGFVGLIDSLRKLKNPKGRRAKADHNGIAEENRLSWGVFAKWAQWEHEWETQEQPAWSGSGPVDFGIRTDEKPFEQCTLRPQ